MKSGILGGAERYVFELARHMAEVTPTTLISFGPHEDCKEAGNLRIEILGDPWLVRGQRTNPFTPRLLPKFRGADVIHCHQTHVLASSVAALYGRLKGKKVFTTDLGGGGWDISAYLSTDDWYRGHLHISEYSRRISGHEGRPNAQVIYGGVDTERYSPAPQGPPLGEDAPILFVGRLLPHKGMDYLIDALPARMKLEIIGQPYDKDYHAELRKRSAGKDVTFHHECGDDALLSAYRRARCVVLPSVYRSAWGQTTRVPELLGQTLLEGMACGKPVVCTAVASMPEIVVDGVTGFIVPPNDSAALAEKLQWLANHPAKAAAMGVEGRARVEQQFSWSLVVQRCLAAYRK